MEFPRVLIHLIAMGSMYSKQINKQKKKEQKNRMAKRYTISGWQQQVSAISDEWMLQPKNSK